MHKKDKDSYKGTTEINGFYKLQPYMCIQCLYNGWFVSLVIV